MALCIIMTWSSVCSADAVDLTGSLYQAPDDWAYRGQSDLAAAGLKPVDRVTLTGGHFWQQMDFEIKTPGRYVLDFKNTSTIGHFRHIILDDRKHPVADMRGGIQSGEANPFFLRHGREVDLPVGHYRLLTELNSPFFLADPRPYLDTLDSYRQAIKPGNSLTLLCLGMFLGLLIYYAAQAIVCWSLSSAMYATFILGNLLYNGMALLVFSDLFDLHWFYLVSVPILFSNCAYILFVMSLLKIRHDNYPRLHIVGVVLLILLSGLIVLASIMPHWSLELDRYGVYLFLIYGLVAGIVRSLDGSITARFYLAAVGMFFVLAVTAVSVNSLSFYTLYIEHIGLFSVSVEIIMLALVLTHQFTRLFHEKEQAIQYARTDVLTGLPNRVALELVLETLPQHGSLTFIDMDGLKYYNDQFGHKRGDELLRTFARHLSERLGSKAQAHRLGGDEFAITCEQGDVSWVQRMLAQAVKDMHASGFESADASSGAAHVHEADGKGKLQHMADCRMYENKRLRKVMGQGIRYLNTK